jgi:tRNA (guanine37-N1)-methyltransferase
MKIDILTLFPEMFSGLNASIIKRAVDKGLAEIRIHDFREFSSDKNKRVDDYSYGGGAGMIISVQPIVDCLRAIENFVSAKKILLAPTGKVYDQNKAFELSQYGHIILICGHYEGVDARISNYIDETLSIGDYILTGGEIAAMAVVDSVVRLVPGVLGNEESHHNESFSEMLLEFPQYTRPQEFEGQEVPGILLSGDHEKIRRYRRFKSLERTYLDRPDLLKKAKLTPEDYFFLEKIKRGEDYES